MTIGEKIKKIRTSKLMTQSELVGTEITRNMLSRIENGAANPSLETVRYIASRLNVSPGFLLAEDEDEKIYLKFNEIRDIKKAYMSEDYRICRDMCLNAESADDDEVGMILAECNLAIAIEEFNGGNLRRACEYFDEALNGCGRTLYRTDSVVAVSAVYFRYMRRISPTVSSNVIEETEANIYPALIDDFCRYATVLDRQDRGDGSEQPLLSELQQRESPYAVHLEVGELLKGGRYSEAYELLRGLLLSDFPIPEPMLYFIFCDLEICCRELQDFKGAYEYSIDKLELLQKLLT